MVLNALAATAVGRALGMSYEEIRRGIEKLQALDGRFHIIEENGITIVDDCYNANPVSMKAAIDVLDMAIGRKVAVLGNMGELGNNEKELHREVGEYAAAHGIDLVCGIGHLAKELVDGATNGSSTQGLWFENKADFLDVMKDLIKDGDNVLVKASHGMDLTPIVEALKNI